MPCSQESGAHADQTGNNRRQRPPELQLHLLPRPARAVHRIHNLQRLIPSSPDTLGFRPIRMASPKSKNCRSNGSSEIAIGSDAPDATSFDTGAGSPASFSTSHTVSLSPDTTAGLLTQSWRESWRRPYSLHGPARAASAERSGGSPVNNKLTTVGSLDV